MTRRYEPGDVRPDGSISGADPFRPWITRGTVWVTYLASIEAEKHGWRRNGVESGDLVQIERP